MSFIFGVHCWVPFSLPQLELNRESDSPTQSVQVSSRVRIPHDSNRTEPKWPLVPEPSVTVSCILLAAKVSCSCDLLLKISSLSSWHWLPGTTAINGGERERRSVGMDAFIMMDFLKPAVSLHTSKILNFSFFATFIPLFLRSSRDEQLGISDRFAVRKLISDCKLQQRSPCRVSSHPSLQN